MNYSNVIAVNRAKMSVSETMLTGMRYNPWGMIARHIDVDTCANLQTHIDAVTDGNLIWVRRDLTQAQHRFVAAHQADHAARGLVPRVRRSQRRSIRGAYCRLPADRSRCSRRSLGAARGSGPRRHRRRQLVVCHKASCANPRVHATRNRIPAPKDRANRGDMTKEENRILAIEKERLRHGGSKDTEVLEQLGYRVDSQPP